MVIDPYAILFLAILFGAAFACDICMNARKDKTRPERYERSLIYELCCSIS